MNISYTGQDPPRAGRPRRAQGEDVQPDEGPGQRGRPRPHQGGGSRQGSDGKVGGSNSTQQLYLFVETCFP